MATRGSLKNTGVATSGVLGLDPLVLLRIPQGSSKDLGVLRSGCTFVPSASEKAAKGCGTANKASEERYTSGLYSTRVQLVVGAPWLSHADALLALRREWETSRCGTSELSLAGAQSPDESFQTAGDGDLARRASRDQRIC